MSRRRIVAWNGLDAWRAEVAVVDLAADGVRARGTQLGVEPEPYRLSYALDARAGWVTRSLRLTLGTAAGDRELTLERDPDGAWRIAPAAAGDAGALAGALDCDLGLSPLTNLMPVRRERLHERPGAAEFRMAWVAVPELTVHASAQRYEHVRASADGAVVRYVDRGEYAGFTAELELDADGLARRYPGLAQSMGAR